ncbi:hypothetical protein [Reichenbachiella sp.]|uniref:hypothetical protein n=1 Tax=Reichenbachiella sp. TaxID=2184521 RepID=UPI003BAF5622
MTKNILIGVLAGIAVFAFVFARIKANEADLQKLSALENLVVAKENQTKAEAQEEKAVQAAAKLAIAQQKVDELERALEVCQ